MNYPDFVAAGAEVMGISPDSASTLERYAREKETPFQFVSDTERSISKAYATGKGSRQSRVTYIIAKGGTIHEAMHHELLIHKHVSGALKQVQSLR